METPRRRTLAVLALTAALGAGAGAGAVALTSGGPEGVTATAQLARAAGATQTTGSAQATAPVATTALSIGEIYERSSSTIKSLIVPASLRVRGHGCTASSEVGKRRQLRAASQLLTTSAPVLTRV